MKKNFISWLLSIFVTFLPLAVLFMFEDNFEFEKSLYEILFLQLILGIIVFIFRKKINRFFEPKK